MDYAFLCVQASKPGYHQNKGWEIFTDAVISTLSQIKEHVVLLLWGAYAKHKIRLIDRDKHLVLTSPHSSPYAAAHGFFGNQPFSKANAYLQDNHFAHIQW